MGKLPTLGKLGGFWKEGGKEEKGKGEGKRGGKGKERQGKRAKGEEGKLGEEENLKWMGKGMKGMDGERYEKKQRTFFFFCLSLFETTEICLGCTKMEISTGKKNQEKGNFLTLPTLDCTPGYALKAWSQDTWFIIVMFYHAKVKGSQLDAFSP